MLSTSLHILEKSFIPMHMSFQCCGSIAAKQNAFQKRLFSQRTGYLPHSMLIGIETGGGNTTATMSKKDKKEKKRARAGEEAQTQLSGTEPSAKKQKKEKKEKKGKKEECEPVEKKSKKDKKAKKETEELVDETHSPITKRPLSKEALKILGKRKKLPCYKKKQEFLELVEKNRVTVLVGETGSGKTTQMPQFLAEKYKKIAVTQPRRVAAMSVAQRVADEMDVELGAECGYLIRFEDKTSEQTKVKYMTDGMLLRECMTDRNLMEYDVIVLDEAHERTLSTDILFGLIKELMRRRSDIKIVVMSATLEADKFQKYFSEDNSESSDKAESGEDAPLGMDQISYRNGVPLMSVSGRMFPVEIVHTNASTKDYVSAAVTKACEIHSKGLAGDILIFLTGEEEIERCCAAIEDYLANCEEQEHGPPKVLPLYSSLPPQQQRQVFQEHHGQRKIVVATNIAETSITIDGVVFVIDCGLVKQKNYNPRTHMECLLVQPISKAAATQRSGRAGRTRPGTCYRLYTKTAFDDQLHARTQPEILRTNLTSALLTLFTLGVEDVVHFDWMDPPSPENMMRALELLLTLKAVDEECNLTDLGRRLAEFPLDPQLARCLVAAGSYGVGTQMASVIALLQGPPCLMRPRNAQKQADRAHRSFEAMEGDFLTLLHIFQGWEGVFAKGKEADNWAWENYLKDRTLRQATSVKRQLVRILEKQMDSGNVEKVKTDGDNERTLLRKSLLAGLFLNIAYCTGKAYVSVKEGQTVEIHPSSCLKHMPEWVIYNEIVLTDKSYIRCCSGLRPEWLLEILPEYFGDLEGHVKNEEARRSLERAGKRYGVGGFK